MIYIIKVYSPVRLFFFRCFLASVQKHMQKENTLAISKKHSQSPSLGKFKIQFMAK